MRLKRKKRILIILTAVLLVVVIIVVGCTLYLSDYYHADMESISAFETDIKVRQELLDDGTLVFDPAGATKGLIFYPGGKVEYTSYIPLMQACASQGVLCVLVEMPFNLAVFDIDAADGIQEMFDGVEEWYIGGHSLGGSMAASYLVDNIDSYEGLVLLGAYSTSDLSDSSIEVLSIYGSEDMVMDRENYDSNISNLPDDFAEVIIEGGCHAYFGMYGSQDGDGNPAITNEEQIRLTAKHIIDMME